MKPVHRASIGQSKSGHTFSRLDTSLCERLRVLAHHVTRSSMPFDLVVKINYASIKRNYVTDLVNENFQCVFDVQRGTESAGDFVKRINLAMGVLDLIVSQDRKSVV